MVMPLMDLLWMAFTIQKEDRNQIVASARADMAARIGEDEVNV